MSRIVAALLFTDVAGYSKLNESQLRVYMETILPEISQLVNKDRVSFIELNTWGDAIFAASQDPYHLAELSLNLRDYFRNCNWENHHISEGLAIRIALHAGVVFTGTDPIRNTEGIIGTQVNLAARVEPITAINEVWSTDQFVKLIDSKSDHRFAFDNLGEQPLAKDFGSTNIWHLRRTHEGKKSVNDIIVSNPILPHVLNNADKMTTYDSLNQKRSNPVLCTKCSKILFADNNTDKLIQDFLGINSTKVSIRYHCDDFNKYFKHKSNLTSSRVEPTGLFLMKNLQQYFQDIDPNLDTIKKLDFYLWAELADIRTLFCIDSPPYNDLTNYILRNYKTYLTGGCLRSSWEEIKLEPTGKTVTQQYIIINTPSGEISYTANKHQKGVSDVFGHFEDLFVIQKLPGFLPKQEQDSGAIDINKTIWVLYGIHTKGTHAGVSLFHKQNIIKFIISLSEAFDGELPTYFEAVYKVDHDKHIVESIDNIKLIHHSELKLRSSVAFQDDKPINLPYFFLPSQKALFPKQNIPVHAVHFDPCSACNFSCPSCIENNSREMNLFLSFKKVSNIFNDLHKARCKVINFYGGEPTIHPDFPSILRLSSSLGFKSLLVTNGSQLFENDLIVAIKNHHNLHIRVSLDGFSSESHSINHGLKRGYDEYEKIVDSIRKLIKDTICPISISFLLNPNAFENSELIRACEFWKNEGITSFHLRPVTDPGGINPRIKILQKEKYLLRYIINQFSGFVVSPEWLNDLVFKDERLQNEDKQYDQCFSAFYRFAISPLIDKKNTNPHLVPMRAANILASETEHAWISLCLYNRFGQRFGCEYPEDFTKWLQTDRLTLVENINPKEKPCNSIICNRHALNDETHNSINYLSLQQ